MSHTLFRGAKIGALLAASAGIFLCPPNTISAADLSSQYNFRPVKLGAGGFVTGFVSHPLDANKRYVRTDVGNAYRWSSGEWRPMVVRTSSGGFPAADVPVPANPGVESVAVDSSNANTVYIALPQNRSADLNSTFPDLPGRLYKSTDSGASFSPTGLSVKMLPNSQWRASGERCNVDPNNGNVIYYGSVENGLFRSTDGGTNFPAVTTGGAPTGNILGIRFSKSEGTTTLNGTTVTKVLYAIKAMGSVYRSSDGGANWSNISGGLELDGKAMFSTIDKNGTLYVAQKWSNNLWRYRNGAWTRLSPYVNAGTIQGVAVHPTDTNKYWIITEGGGLTRTDNDGANWIKMGANLQYANTWAWLPQQVAYRAHGQIHYDKDGKLWIPQGNEGVLKYTPTYTENETNPPKWTIESQGIEEFVTSGVYVPKGLGGKAFGVVQDGTGFVFTNPDTFSAKHIQLADQFLAVSNSISYCPNNPQYLAIAASDGHKVGNLKCYSGYSTDGGTSWQKFASYPKIPEKNNEEIGWRGHGSIAVSRRNGWGNGSDHIVWLPGDNFPPYYSTNGGATWSRTTSFPITTSGDSWNIGKMSSHTGFSDVSLKQQNLKADPFVADKFYLNLLWDGFYISTNGGQTWTKQNNSGAPANCWHGQVEVNMNVQNDIWISTGWEGAGSNQLGIWRSTNGGANWNKVSGPEHSIVMALGAGRGQSGDQPFTVYFYGKLSGDSVWGVFRSTDGGATWDRISAYPAGITDQPTCMAADWDTFSKVWIGTAGNSYIIGTAGGGTTPTPTPTPTPAPTGNGTGLKGEYFSNTTFGTLIKTQTDAKIDFDWGSGAPKNTDGTTMSSMPVDGFSVRWTGQIQAQEGGTYTFSAIADDKIKVWVGDTTGTPIINQTAYNNLNPTTGTFSMTAGQKYDIKVEFIEDSGGAQAKLRWIRPGQSSAVTVPQSQLYPPGTASVLLSQGKPAVSSSVEHPNYNTPNAFDGNTGTRWTGVASDPQWIYVDLGANKTITSIKLNWEYARSNNFVLQSAPDGATNLSTDSPWTTLSGGTVTAMPPTGVTTYNATGNGRYVRMKSISRGTPYGVSLWEFEVWGY